MLWPFRTHYNKRHYFPNLNINLNSWTKQYLIGFLTFFFYFQQFSKILVLHKLCTTNDLSWYMFIDLINISVLCQCIQFYVIVFVADTPRISKGKHQSLKKGDRNKKKIDEPFGGNKILSMWQCIVVPPNRIHLCQNLPEFQLKRTKKCKFFSFDPNYFQTSCSCTIN